MRIGQVARRAGIAPSAIRYYESIGLLPAPLRVSGRRDYSPDVLAQLALIARGRACGIRLEEMKRALAAGRTGSPRDIWKPLVDAKLAELAELEAQLAIRRRHLMSMRGCRCRSMENCARLVWEHVQREARGP